MTSAGAPGNDGLWQIDAGTLSGSWAPQADGSVMWTHLRVAGREWITAPCPVWSLATTGDAIWADVQGGANDGVLTLAGSLRDTGLTITVRWEADVDASVLTVTPTVTNATDRTETVPALTSVRLTTPVVAGTELSLMTGGAWDESLPPGGYRHRTFRLDDIRGTLTFSAAADGRSTGDYMPWFSLTDGQTGLAASLIWSGRWSGRASRTGDQISLEIGLSDFTHELAPGESLELPAVALFGFTGDLDAATDEWRRWVTHALSPAPPEHWPWVQYNHWYAYYGDIDAARLLEEARYAAGAGCEVFVIDDGWFVGRRPDSYIQGWGTWREDRAKFPEGLRALSEHVHTLGMRFGLWVEPERVALQSEVAQAHPDWLVQHGGTPMTRRYGSDEGAHLCLGVPTVQDWMATEVTRVVQDYGVDWLKWDYNIGYGLGCDCPDHGHQAGDGHYAHTLGLYRVLERIRAACPVLVIENCASGGHRADLGLVRYTDTNWLSDYTHQAASCRQHAQGAGWVLPLAHLNTWTLEERTMTEFRSRMGGAFGVSSHLGEWTDADRQVLATAVTEYKHLRPILGGERYLLTGPLHQQWDIWQFVSRDRGSFAILAFREGGHVDEVNVSLRGLDPHARYEMTREEDTEDERTGERLMSDGLRICLSMTPGSAIVWGQRCDRTT